MKVLCITCICLACALLAGCNEGQVGRETTRQLDIELVNTLNNIAIENAIITQQTLYPYHFGPNAAELNDLGQRDLLVLARHFRENPGTLNIRRAEIDGDLYDARVAHVLSRLKEAGVEMDRISVSDGMPGGTGMPSESVVTILQKQSEPLTGMRSGSGGMITR